MIEEVVGDLLAQDVDCIVNAANEQLQLGGGVAGAIRRADRSGEVQRECNEIIAKKGSVPTGQDPDCYPPLPLGHLILSEIRASRRTAWC